MGAVKNNHRKLVRRIYSDRYVLITLVSFAISISAIRFFLAITGYPQLGGENLHIAHVLWGGLFLFASSLLPLIFVNKRILDLSAILSGVGIGLFIDEVGKFITQTNDYFYPAAAPIIYVFFLLTIQIYRMIRKPVKNDLRTNLFHTLEEFEELLEGDLSGIEKEKIITRMEKTEYAAEEKDLIALKDSLVLFLKHPSLPFVEHKSDLFERIANWFSRIEEMIFNQKHFNVRLRLTWVFMGLILIAQPLFILSSIDEPIDMSGLLRRILDSSLLFSENINILGMLRIVLQIISGLLLWVCACFYKNEESMKWVSFAQLILLIVLSAINSLVFLYDQFSTIIFVIIEFIVFFLTARFLNWRTDTYL